MILGRVFEEAMVVPGGLAMDFKGGLPASLGGGVCGTGGGGHGAGPRRESLDGLGEGEAVKLHQKMEQIAAGAAAEAMEGIAVRADDERGAFLLMEGAEALVIFARFFQLDEFADEFDDRNSFS